METPSYTRRVTRSQTRAANTNFPSSRKVEESVKNQQQDRSALFDITNDSPIVGVAMESLRTPSSKKRMNNQGVLERTPGSGEALLRGQVKTLLQRVEEEADMSKITPENRPFFNRSPTNLVAPTPANTPQIFNLEADGDGLPSVTPVIDKFLIPQKQGSIECESQITRTLLFDFSDKSEKVCTDDDDSSVWSIQVNASTREDEEEEDEQVESCCNEEDYYEEEEEEEEEEEYQLGSSRWLLDDVCEGMSKISVKGGPKLEGKHIRFVYNSDGEIEKEEEMCGLESDDMI